MERWHLPTRGRATVPAALLIGALLVTPAAPTGSRAATGDEAVIEGTVDIVGAGLLSVLTGIGRAWIATDQDTRVLGRRPARFDEIAAGDFVGVASNRQPDGSLTATSITILPAALRGLLREGQWPMDTGQIMTNAVVTAIAGEVQGRRLALSYQDGSAMIAVPPAAEVHRLTVITLDDLRPGMHVMATGTTNADRSMTASSIIADVPEH